MYVELKGCPWCGKVPKPPREIVEGKVWSMGCEGHLHHSAGAMSWVSAEDCIAQWNNRHGAGDAEEGSLRFIAKRNLRKMIEIGSTDKKTMLLCLEELS